MVKLDPRIPVHGIMSRDIPTSWITSTVGWGDSIQPPPFHPKMQLCTPVHSHTRQYLMGRAQKHLLLPKSSFVSSNAALHGAVRVDYIAQTTVMRSSAYRHTL